MIFFQPWTDKLALYALRARHSCSIFDLWIQFISRANFLDRDKIWNSILYEQ